VRVVLLGDFLWSVDDILLGILDAEIVVPLTKEDSVDVVILQCKLESRQKMDRIITRKKSRRGRKKRKDQDEAK